MFIFLDSRESQGKAFLAIIDGVISSIMVNIKLIIGEPHVKMVEYTRGNIMSAEKYSKEILSGVRGGRIALKQIITIINSRDFENSKEIMNIEGADTWKSDTGLNFVIIIMELFKYFNVKIMRRVSLLIRIYNYSTCNSIFTEIYKRIKAHGSRYIVGFQGILLETGNTPTILIE